MNKSSTSVMAFGVYLIGMGAGLTFMPNVVMSTLGLPPTDEVWSRVVGLLALLLAFYYIQAARTETKAFMQWTVVGRIYIFVSFVALVLVGMVGPVMILLGLVDLFGALWTGWALRTEK